MCFILFSATIQYYNLIALKSVFVKLTKPTSTHFWDNHVFVFIGISGKIFD